MRDLRRRHLNRNLEENASGETAVLYGKGKNQKLRHRLRSKQGKLQSAVPVPVPNHEHQMSEDVSIWSSLCHASVSSDQHQHSFRKEIIVSWAKSYLWNLLTGDDVEDRLLSYTFIDTGHRESEDSVFVSPGSNHLHGCDAVLGELHLQIEEDDHESFESDFHISPDDQSQYIQDGKLLILYLHQQYKNLALVVLFLISEAISFVLDFIGKGKLGIIVAAFVLALFVFTPTLWVYFEERSNRSPNERPIANVELLFSGIQLLTTLLHLIFELKGVDDKYNLYNLSYLPLAFAFYRVFSAIFAFRKEHENGTGNAAEPLAEVKVSQHDGSRNIMVHMTVTGKPLNMVIDLTMVTCYEQLFRKLRDEMSQAEKVLWGDKSRWNVRYLDISGVTHGLHEDEISWDEFCTAARKIFISRKEVRKELYRRCESMPRTSEKGLERALFT